LVYLRGKIALLFNHIVQQYKPDYPENGVANGNYQHPEPHSRNLLMGLPKILGQTGGAGVSPESPLPQMSEFSKILDAPVLMVDYAI
jgi:hypothetical protein